VVLEGVKEPRTGLANVVEPKLWSADEERIFTCLDVPPVSPL
jgi:hypothetical protein